MLKSEFIPRKAWPDRFWDKVDKNGPVPEHCPELGQCWVWTGATSFDGYGHVRFAGRVCVASRIAWFIYYNTHPDKLVLHKCDNRLCVRESHLFSGTDADNSTDMIAKGRSVHVRGEDQHCAKLTGDQVIEILDKLSKGQSWSSLAKEYNVVKGTIGHIARGRSWKHVSSNAIPGQ